jgi:TM2 domain-containing membrane protein YozV
MTNQLTRPGRGVLALIVTWGIVGMAVDLTQGPGSPAMVWVWAAGAIVAGAVAIIYARKIFRRAAR